LEDSSRHLEQLKRATREGGNQGDVGVQTRSAIQKTGAKPAEGGREMSKGKSMKKEQKKPKKKR